MELSDRQQSILALIVRAYTESAKPIGSKKLLERYSLNVSSATVRNEMVALTEAGFLRQPHTSAGRVPTEAGYRYFVRGLLGDSELPNAEKRLISHQFHQAHADIDEWVRLSASVLAQHSHVAALVTTPRPERAVFKHLKLIATEGQQVLLVLVLQGGDVRQQILTLARIVDQSQLEAIASQITASCNSKDTQFVSDQIDHFTELAVMRTADLWRGGFLYLDEKPGKGRDALLQRLSAGLTDVRALQRCGKMSNLKRVTFGLLLRRI